MNRGGEHSIRLRFRDHAVRGRKPCRGASACRTLEAAERFLCNVLTVLPLVPHAASQTPRAAVSRTGRASPDGGRMCWSCSSGIFLMSRTLGRGRSCSSRVLWLRTGSGLWPLREGLCTIVLHKERAMLSDETLASYRRMTAKRRLTITLQMMRENTPYLLRGSSDIVAHRFERIRQENDTRNQNMLSAIARRTQPNEGLSTSTDRNRGCF